VNRNNIRRAATALSIACLPLGTGCTREASAPPPSQVQSPPSVASRPSPEPVVPDTLSGLRDLPEFYDEDPSTLLTRYARKLISDGQTAKNFALLQLAAAGEKGVPEIVAVMDEYMMKPGYFATITNCCQALAGTKTKDERAISALVRALHHESGTARSEAARSLGILRDGRAFPALKEAFSNSSIEERKVIVKALGNLDAAGVEAELYEIASSEIVAIGYREIAMQGLVQRPLAAAEPYLRKSLSLPTPLKQAALVPTGDTQIVQKARSLALDPSTVFCSFASAALARVGDFDGALNGLRSNDANVRLLLGLGSIRAGVEAGKADGPQRRAIVEALRAREGDSDSRVRIEAMRLLVKLGETPPLDRDLADLESSATDRVAAALDSLTDLQIADRRATQPIVRKLHEAPLQRKRGFIQALGRLRDPASVPDVERYLYGPTDKVDGIWLCDYAAQQLANFGEPGFRALMRAWEKTGPPSRKLGIATAFTHCVEPRAEISAQLLKIAENASEHPEVRAVAIRFLPIFMKGECVPPLKRLLSIERNRDVRRLINSTLFEYF
jgi:HEAT repeat protein